MAVGKADEVGDSKQGFWDIEACGWVGGDPAHVVPAGLSRPADLVDPAAPGDPAAALAGATEAEPPAV